MEKDSKWIDGFFGTIFILLNGIHIIALLIVLAYLLTNAHYLGIESWFLVVPIIISWVIWYCLTKINYLICKHITLTSENTAEILLNVTDWFNKHQNESVK